MKAAVIKSPAFIEVEEAAATKPADGDRLAHNTFVTAFGGNAAWKLKEDLFVITPTRMCKPVIRMSEQHRR